MFDVVVLGSANLDLVASTPRHPAPGETVLGASFDEFAGGKGLNQAVAAARAGAGVAFVGALGDDSAGQHLRQVMVDDGIDISGLNTDRQAPTGRAMIVVSDDGENSIVVIPGANSSVTGAPIPATRIVLAQLEIPVTAVSAGFSAARESGALTVLNPAPATSLDSELLALCDIVIPNEHEVELLGGVAALHDAGVPTVIVTKGRDGVTVSTMTAGTTDFPAPAVHVVDTTGAGDAFCGNLVARLAAGIPLPDATRWAVAAASLAVTAAGAVPSLPTAVATAATLNSNP